MINNQNQQINYLDLAISKFGSDYTGPDSTGNIQYNCPFCLKRRGKADTDRKLYVKVKIMKYKDHKIIGKFHCFKCGAKGRISNRFNSNNQVYNRLFSLYNQMEDESSDDEEAEDNVFYIPNIKIPYNSVAEKYLLERNITRDMMNYYNLRLGVDSLFGRIVIPNEIYDNVWTDMYSARSYLGHTPKYMNPVDAEKHNFVFNINNLIEGGVCYVVEGPITAICAGKEACATYGCSPSDVQISMIVNKNFEEIYCVYDNDEAGRKGNLKLSEKLFDEINIKNLRTKLFTVLMPEEIDAADMGESKFKEYVMSNRVPYRSKVYNKLFTVCKERNN